MKSSISVVINTFNEEKNIEQALKSVNFVDEVIVCDMHSTDNTVKIAEKFGAKVIYHKYVRYVEPARNYAISKTKSDWVLILDADEIIPERLADNILDSVSSYSAPTFIEIPRKNIIFGKWMKASGWWPDFHIRFFQKGSVVWQDEIHSKPKTVGLGIRLSESEENAIVHHHYVGITQFIERLNRYSSIQAEELSQKGIKFHWADLFSKPLSEFLSRYFAQRGFEDGLHGLALGLLQAFSFLVVYLKLWEMRNFPDQRVSIKDLKTELVESGKEIKYWIKFVSLSKNPIKRIIQKILK